jgi:hypothetical protein
MYGDAHENQRSFVCKITEPTPPSSAFKDFVCSHLDSSDLDNLPGKMWLLLFLLTFLLTPGLSPSHKIPCAPDFAVQSWSGIFLKLNSEIF